jgi:hypothetical protein
MSVVAMPVRVLDDWSGLGVPDDALAPALHVSVRTMRRWRAGMYLQTETRGWLAAVDALYLALSPQTCIAEIVRQFTPATWPPRQIRFTELHVELTAVIDCRAPSPAGLALNDLCDDTDWSVPRSLVAAARARQAEALLVPSATRWGANLIVFPDLLREGAVLRPVSHVDPRLYRAPFRE